MGEMITVNIKPMSVNDAWQGRRYKTPQYNKYQRDVLLLLPKITVPPGRLKLILELGFSNIQSDLDNPIKQILDILQKKYIFNDSRIWEINATKVKVEKGKEYFKFEFLGLD